jgi:hypothetical protein
MTGKQFVFVLLALGLLVAAGVGLQAWKRSSYQAADLRVGQKLVDFRIDDVAEIRIVEPQSTATLVRGEKGWTVKERGDFPADVEPIRELLLRLAEIKVVQAEGLSDAVKPRLQLAAPDAGAKPEESGTALELKGRDGKTLASLLLGRKIHKDAKIAMMPEGIPTGRYILVAAEPQRVNVVNDAFVNVLAKPERWLVKELFRVERPKSIVALGPDGKEDWTLTKETEEGFWKLVGPGTLDLQKGTDAGSALYALPIADAAPGVSDADAGLDKPRTIRAQTYDGWTYELKIGKSAPENRYYLRSSVAGTVPQARTPPADEKAEDKEKAEKAFAERREALEAKLAREQSVAGRTVLATKTSVDALLRDRKGLLKVDAPKDAKAKDAKKK